MKMIPWKFVILAVLLVHAHSAAAFNHRIDPARCKTDAKDATCFVRESCMNITDGTGKQIGKDDVLAQFNDQELIGDACDVFVQIKSISTKLEKWHVMMNVTGDKLDTSKGISFTQEVVQFKCLDNNNVEGKLTPEVFGGGNTFSSTMIFCSITISSSSAKMDFAENEDKPTISYFINVATDQEQKIKFSKKSDAFWKLIPKESCHTERVSSKEDMDENFLLHEVDITLPNITCNEGSGTLRLKFINDIQEVDKLYCDAADSSYKFKSRGSALADLPQSIDFNKTFKSFEVFCAVKFCSLCAPLGNTPCAGCKPPDTMAPDTSESCRTAKCPFDTKWRLPEGILSDDAPVCKKNGATASWYRGDAKITEGACSAKADCLVYSNLTFACPTEGCIEAKLTDDNQTVYCPDGYNVKFESTVATGNLTCNTDNGLYSYGEGNVPKHTKIECEKRSDPSVAAPSTGSSAGQTAGIVIGVLFLVVIIAILIFFLIKKRRRNADANTPYTEDPNVKTARCTNSTEGLAAATKSASGSEAPTSTDRPTTEKIGSEGPPSTERPSKEKMPDEEKNKDDKSGDKKYEKKGSQKEENKEGERSKKEKKEKKEEEKKPKKKPPKKPVPNLQEVNRVLEQMKGNEPANAKMGKRIDASDITLAQILLADKPGNMIDNWNEEMFREDLLPIVALLKTDDRCYFLRNLTVFEQHSTKGTAGVNGSLTQFFQVVRRCEKKKLDCPPTWEIIIRLVKLLCANLPQKEAADIIDRMRKMMRGIGHMMLKDIGFVTNINRDTDDHKLRRELAIRILLATDDPVALEEMAKHAEAKPDDVDSYLQTAVFSHALNRMGKKQELEARLYEELKKSAKEYPKPKDQPFGTLRQHLIYALCSDKNGEGMRAVLEMVVDPTLRRDKSTPEGEFNPTDVLCAYRGATEHAGHFKKVLAVIKAKQFAPNKEELTEAVVAEYAKSPEEKRELTKQMKADILETLLILAESCVTNEQYLFLHRQIGAEFTFIKTSGRDAFDAKKFDYRTCNLEAILKNKKCIEMIDEAMKKSDY